jgi:hypothetical protein
MRNKEVKRGRLERERGEEERGGKKVALGRARAQKYCISTLVVFLCAYFFSMFPASLSRVKPQFIDKPTFRGLTLFGTAIPRCLGTPHPLVFAATVQFVSECS